MQDRIEAKWIACFRDVFAMCRVQPGDSVAILSETQSRPLNVHLAELALGLLGAQAFHIVLPTARQTAPVPVRSTGTSFAIGRLGPVIKALAASTMVVDLTIEGLLHAVERPTILAEGARILMISNEHPDILERLMPDPGLKTRVQAGIALGLAAREMHVTSAAGTDLRIAMEGAKLGGGWGWTDEPGTMDYWPGGLCAFFAPRHSVNGTLVMDRGDLNLTFKRYLESPIRLEIVDDFVVAIEGTGTDAALMRSYIAAWGDREAYGAAHAGWGMNERARWDALTMYDRADLNGTEQRAFAGNFLYSTGANQFVDRYTPGHFDLPMRNCTIALDHHVVVREGALQPPLAGP